jgi:hypothetical protein
VITSSWNILAKVKEMEWKERKKGKQKVERRK